MTMLRGPHVSPEDFEVMKGLEERRNAALEADPEVRRLLIDLEAAHVVADEARNRLEDVRSALSRRTDEVLSQVL